MAVVSLAWLRGRAPVLGLTGVLLATLVIVTPVARGASLGPLTLVSATPTGEAGNADSGSESVAVSDDGTVVAFVSHASDLVPGDVNGQPDVFVRDLQSGTMVRITGAAPAPSEPAPSEPAPSPMVTPAPIPTPSPMVTPDIPTPAPSEPAPSEPAPSGPVPTPAQVTAQAVNQPNGPSGLPAISGDGRFVAFGSAADNLVPDDTNGRHDVFVYDRVTGALERVSVSSDEEEGDRFSNVASLSYDGRYVAFVSEATNFGPTPDTTYSAIYVRDRLLGTTTVVPNDFGDGCHYAGNPNLSADGMTVVYLGVESDCANFNRYGIYAHDFATNTATYLSSASDGTPANEAFEPVMSDDGRFVAFRSASRLVPGDTDDYLDVYFRDRVLGTIERISETATGEPLQGTTYDPPYSFMPSGISLDGRYVAFQSNASNLVPGDTNNSTDMFLRDRANGSTVRVNVTPEGYEAFGSCGGCGHRGDLTPDGRTIGFYAFGALLPGDGNSTADVYLRDLTPVAPEATAEPASAGSSVSTDGEADGATPDDPVETTVTTPVDGVVTITELSDTGGTAPPEGFSFLGGTVVIEAPEATPEAPLILYFAIDPVTHGGMDPGDLVVFRDGVPVEACDPDRPDPGAAIPDPCVASRSGGYTEDILMTVLTSHASDWNLGFDQAETADTSPPTIDITSPVDGAAYVLGEQVAAAYSCADADSGVASCAGTVESGAWIDTGSVGTHGFTVEATDVAGNGASATVWYSVLYDFSGFFQPVDNGVLNRVKAGQTVPVKFSLNGDHGLGVLVAATVVTIGCPSGQADAIEQTVAGSGSTLSYDARTDQYLYAFRTSKNAAGTCQRLTLYLDDGTAHSADFQLTR